MATLVTLTEMKDHLRITGTNEDTRVQAAIDAASDHVANICNDQNLPAANPLKMAAKLIAADFYENPAALVDVTLMKNPQVMNLIWPYRKCVGI